MAEVASAFVTLLPSARGFGRATERQVGGQVSTAGVGLGKTLGRSMFGAAAAAGTALGIGRLFSDSIGEAREAQKVGALTSQVIKTTGGAANVSAKQVGNLATAISNKVGIDDEAIQSGANLLLTFKNVRNEVGRGNKVFDRATRAAVDLSAAGFGDMSATSKQLGKALNDPVKGITALGRAGVTFTDQQKKQIKTLVESGRTLDAQKIILKEVEAQVGGAAAAQATAGDRLGVAFGNLKESIGTALLPVIDRVATFLVEKAIPALQDFGPVLGRIIDFVKPAIAGFKSLGDGGGRFSEQITQVRTTAASVFASLRSIFASAVAIITVLWRTFGDSITTYALGAFKSILTIVRGAFTILQGIFQIFSALLRGDWSGVWEGIKTTLRGAWTVIKGLVQGGWNTLRGIFSLAGDALGKLMGLAWDGVKAAVSNGIRNALQLIRGLPSKIAGALGDLSKVLFDAGTRLIQGLIDGITSKIGDLKNKMGDLVGSVKGFLPGSPIKEGPLRSWNNGGAGKRLVDLLALGLEDTRSVDHAMSRLTGRLADVQVQPRSAFAAAMSGHATVGRSGVELEQAFYRGIGRALSDSGKVVVGRDDLAGLPLSLLESVG